MCRCRVCRWARVPVTSATAQAALLLWPLVAVALYLSRDSLSATFWTIVGGFLLLPVGAKIDFPMIPPIDKESLPPLLALLGLRFIKGRRVPLLPERGYQRVLVLLLLLVPVFTVFTNGEPVISERRFIQGLTWYDAASSTVHMYLSLLPFMIGLALVRRTEDLITVARLFVIAGLAYSLLVLLEVRLSPQLHNWVYGYHPHSFGQQMRFDGFRPMVFIGHGLTVSMFMAMTLGFAALLWKSRVRALPVPPALPVIYLVFVLVLCKTVSAWALGSLMVVAIALLSVSNLHRLGLIIVCFVIAYPTLTLLDLVPKAGIVAQVGSIFPDRAASLAFRFFHENQLLARAFEKPWFGWGGWGRNRLEDSVTDGFWIIKVGVTGLVGFFSYFALLMTPLLRRAPASAAASGSRDALALTAFGFILAVFLVDQLPNASMAAPYLFLFGAYAGARYGQDAPAPLAAPQWTWEPFLMRPAKKSV